MTPIYRIPAHSAQAQIEISRSVFIASAAPAFSIEEAKAFIHGIKEKYSDATHNVPAYVIGHPPNVIEHCNDDGEPSGTAGRPALSILRGSGYGDIAVVITRYFGGIKLGKGGLVRAYSDAVREVLSVLPAAQKAASTTCQIILPYSHVDLLQHLVASFNGKLLHQEYRAEVTFQAKFLDEDFNEFLQALDAKTSGSLSAEVIARNPSDILKLKDSTGG